MSEHQWYRQAYPDGSVQIYRDGQPVDHPHNRLAGHIEIATQHPEPPQNFPPMTEQAKGLMTTMTTWAKEGFPLSKDKAARWALCEACPDIQDGRCLHCGCFMRGKIYLDTAHCALGKW